ncbi:hypothetical protein O0Q50_23415 [Priestia aryabhattai]|uniref:DUF4154 domain-containing protein n=1 Tax=Priestia aryabhattai TaxID=412384 RepID=A0AAX6NED2_PRIAR|nr:hypothetical protein [Priestia aryabhattai]MDU9694137.1 hypothetical protein [Priestia aryabhattai]
MDKHKQFKKGLVYRSIFVLASVIVLAFIWNHYVNNTKQVSPKTTTTSTEDKTVTTTVSTTSKAPKKPIDVLSLGKSPFENDSYAMFHKTTLKQLSNLEKTSIVIVDDKYMVKENQKLFIELAKKHHTILFYNEEVSAEKVVGYLDGIVPVVPIESSNPLKFQAYGITTLDDSLIPVFVSVTTDQNTLNEKSFKELIKQVYEKAN